MCLQLGEVRENTPRMCNVRAETPWPAEPRLAAGAEQSFVVDDGSKLPVHA